MSFSYSMRLVCLSLASFFAVHAAASVMVWLAAPVVIRVAERMRARVAAAVLFALCVGPLLLALLAVLGLCVPSYVKLEPRTAGEQVGWVCVGLAMLGVVMLVIVMLRVIRAVSVSLKYIRRCRQIAQERYVPGESTALLVIEGDQPLLSLAGVLRPRLVVSEPVMRALSAEELEVALRHEQAHRDSRDNLKRLCVMLGRGMFPFSRAVAPVESHWARFAEWAADDRAAAGDSRRALSLASALVRVAKLGRTAPLAPLMISLLAGDEELAARVDRLVRLPLADEPPAPPSTWISGVVLAALFVGLTMLHPATLPFVHHLLETIVH